MLFSRLAGRDVRDAAAWIAHDNPTAAEHFVRAVTEAARRLQARPGLARSEPRLAPARYRFWSLRGFSYLMVLDAEADPPHVVRVVHTARDLPKVLRDIAGEL